MRGVESTDRLAGFRARMRTLRTEAGLSANAAAARSGRGISAQRWRSIERGYEVRGGIHITANPTRDTVAAIARVLGWDLGEALGLAGLGPATDRDTAVGPDPWDTVDAAWPRLTAAQRVAVAGVASSMAYPNARPMVEVTEVGTDWVEPPADGQDSTG